MNSALLLAVALVVLSSCPFIAQQTNPGSSPVSPATLSASSGTSDAAAAPMRQVNGELLSKLDSKTAKDGDSVVVKTDEKVTIADGTVIPKGSKLVGHVTDVQAHGKGVANAKMVIQLDHAELKGGQSLPIHSVIQSLAPATDMAAGSDMGSASPMGGVAATGGMSGGRPGGGSAGSGGGQAANSVPVPAPASSDTGPAMAGGSGAPQPGRVVAKSGDIAVRTTAIPGILIASEASGQPLPNASGMFYGAQQNIHLDSGTRMVLSVAAAGADWN
jgi:hypothetical protein